MESENNFIHSFNNLLNPHYVSGYVTLSPCFLGAYFSWGEIDNT